MPSAGCWPICAARLVIADWITAIAGTDPHLIMLLMVLLFTIIGDFIEPVPTIIIFMPLVNALTQAGDINPVHMGVVLIATLAFGLITPPYGLVLLMASKFVGVRFSQALRAALPIYVVFWSPSRSVSIFPRSCCGCPSTSSRRQSAASRRQTDQVISVQNRGRDCHASNWNDRRGLGDAASS